jgi:hypothetical protein
MPANINKKTKILFIFQLLMGLVFLAALSLELNYWRLTQSLPGLFICDQRIVRT